ncbi:MULTISPECIES: HNH endonuclease signature motif containing protein [unclassified Microbacterium]|uniref:HNH endonuclease signature motif containing protein n=1 Tax=unclassified Microbacterium TaxID=2609290 RepID=UPI0025FACD80|nr:MULTISPECIES: HNH endonuclease signature motif containing protein [unclassified Microbacterium]
MDLLTSPLRDLLTQASAVLRDATSERALERATEHELAAQLGMIAELNRLGEALLIDAVGEVMRRSEPAVRDERMTSHLGCRDVTELIQQITRVEPRTAAKLQRAAKAVRPEVSATTGERLDAAFPSVRDAMLDGVLGTDGILAITAPLQETAPRVSAAARQEAADVVVAEARGEGPSAAPPLCAELLKIHAQAWALALDPDGAEPRERVAERRRALTLGVATPAGVPIHGLLVPEVAAQLQTIWDAQTSPKVAFDDPTAVDADGDLLPLPAMDDRTRAQKQHDAFAAALSVAATSGLLPTIGGYAPVLVVSVDEHDLVDGTGYAHVQGCDQPISIAIARHIACSGSIQRIVSRNDGRIIRLGTEERVFNRQQRRAIALRDGGCIIPGCGTPAAWCEIHHVTEYAQGGPTHTDNGVLLCWYHHRFLDRIGWKIRMNQGVPEVLAPPWHDISRRWRPTTTSPLRLKKRVLRT